MSSQKKSNFGYVFFIIATIALIVASFATVKFVRYLEGFNNYVVLDDDGYVVEITTHDKTVRDILDRYKITLNPGDTIEPDIDTRLEKETLIRITRAIPVTIMADGVENTVYLTGGTVEDALEKAEVKVREKDKVNLGMNEPLIPDTYITVTRMDEKVFTEKEAIPYQAITKKNHNMDEGVDRVVQEGRQGELERKILVVYKDGEEISRKVVSEEVTVKPVDRIVEKGTVKNITTSRGNKIRYSKVRTMSATAYSSGVKTASGKTVKPFHTIAAPRDIPFGTKVYIPELVQYWKKRGVEISGIFTVEDRGGAIKGNKIDVYMTSESVARNWGVRNVTVYFIK